MGGNIGDRRIDGAQSADSHLHKKNPKRQVKKRKELRTPGSRQSTLHPATHTHTLRFVRIYPAYISPLLCIISRLHPCPVNKVPYTLDCTLTFPPLLPLAL